MIQPKKLIEVAMPIKEISAESVRDKSIRHGHISTLHLWWARRPLPVCRAVVFASLVPDPLDPDCPQAFKDALEMLLGSPEKPLKETGIHVDAYKPYEDIPWTSIFDPVEDNLRNRLQMFIGKFTEQMQQHLLHNNPKPQAKELITDNSLIKWDNKNNEKIINKARKLIFVAHNALNNFDNANKNPSASARPAGVLQLFSEFDTLYSNIKTAENELYSLHDRHLETQNSKLLTLNLHNAIEAFLERMPKVFDPFAGGGAIPLESARLGCRSFGNDINPVAHIIQKGSVEFPQKYGKPITYTKDEFLKIYGEDLKLIDKPGNQTKLKNNDSILLENWDDAKNKTFLIQNSKFINIKNRLSFDVEFYAKKLLAQTEKEIGHLYPANEKGEKPIAYYWARVATCSNPTCKAEVPLLKQFYLANTKTKHVYLKPTISGNQIDFEIKIGKYDEISSFFDKNLKCPCCGNATSIIEIKNQSITGKLKLRLLAIIEDSNSGKTYRIPTELELKTGEIDENLINPLLIPNEEMKEIPDLVSGRGWGIKKWSQMFSPRQLLAMQTLVSKLNELKNILKSNENEYEKAIITYLSILINRIAILVTNLGRWDSTTQHGQSPFSRQAIAMMLDFPEYSIFSISTTQLDWITRFIDEESINNFVSILNNASSGEKEQFIEKSITCVVTDPPYYDAIAYADLSDFFYVWFKRTLADIYPLNFTTPQTPKGDECTALKHHHNDSKNDANKHFENKLLEIFDAIEHQTSDIVSIMFAHQSTEAWATLCNSILGARMNITGSWAIDTEYSDSGLKTGKSFLSSSVTVACKPSQRAGFGDFKEVKKAIEKSVIYEVEELYKLGFRGADLLTACFGKAVSEFGKYEKVEKADGSQVTVAELLELTRESAFNALLKGFDGDDFTKFYIGWLQLNGFTENDFDDVAKFSRVGLSINVSELFTEHILIKNGNKQTLGNFEQRLAINKNLGERNEEILINRVHRGMWLYQSNDRKQLLSYINRYANTTDSNFWRVLTSLKELLPDACQDHKMVCGLLTNRENLIRESKTVDIPKTEDAVLF